MPDANEPKKETVRITLPPRPAANPAGASRDTVRINLPTRPAPNGAEPPRRLVPPPPQVSGGAPAPRPPMARPPMPAPSAAVVRPPTFTAPPAPASVAAPAPAPRIVPPSQPPPAAKIPPPSLTPPLRPPIAGQSAVAAVAAAPSPVAALPKKETARISVLPDPPKPLPVAVKMTKTQPLVTTLPPTTVKPAPITVSSVSAVSTFDAIPMALCWTVFGISALTLLIELWNYFV